MATYRTDVATFDTAAGAKTATITTVAGDYLIALTVHSTAGAAIFDHAVTDNQGGTWYRVAAIQATTASAAVINVWVRTTFVTTGASTIVTTTPGGTSTGGGLDVIAVSGMLREGVAGIRQLAYEEMKNAGTPTPTFRVAPLTENMVLGIAVSADNPAALTPRTGFTERQDLGYATPTLGMEVMTRDSGETTTAINWGSATLSVFGSMAVELDVRSPDMFYYPTPVLNTKYPISKRFGPIVLLQQGSRPEFVQAATEWTDDFNRATLDSAWVATANAYTIVSNQLAGPPGLSAMRYYLPVLAGTQYSQIVYKDGTAHGVAVAMTGFASGLAFGAAGVDTFYIFRRGVGGGETNLLQKDLGGTGTTTLLAAGPDVSPGDVMRLEYDGTTLTGYINGLRAMQTNPSSPISLVTNQYVGVQSNAANSGIVIADNWAGGKSTGVVPITYLGTFGIPMS